jgi:multidrug efflux pump subunit AcrA (membrane-fusion protein)
MYAEVDLTTEQRRHVHSVPVEAIDGSGNSTRVFAVRSSGTVQVIPVGLGIENAQRVEVISGDLHEGDAVVVGSRSGLKEGIRVLPKIVTLASNSVP